MNSQEIFPARFEDLPLCLARPASQPNMPHSNKCIGCGCICQFCGHDLSLEYHHEIEELQSRLKEQRVTMKNLENELNSIRENANEEAIKLRDELTKQKDRYDRLYDSHKKQCKLNHLLEHNLTSSAEKFQEETERLRTQVHNLTQELSAMRAKVNEAEEETALYKRDCEIAVNLLQANPSVFRSQSWQSIPNLLQERLAAALSPGELSQFTRQQGNLSSTYVTAASGGLGVTIPSSSLLLAGSVGGSVQIPADGNTNSEGIPVDRLAAVLGQNAAVSGLMMASRLHKVVCTRCRLVQCFATTATQTTSMLENDIAVDSSLIPSSSSITMPISTSVHSQSSTISSRRLGRVLDV